MPFILKEYPSKIGDTLQTFMVKDLNFPLKVAQKLISKNRVYKKDKNTYYRVGAKVEETTILVAVFEGISKGLKPIFEDEYLAIFNKPANLLSHPNSRLTKYCLLDEVKFLFGDSANIVNRLDFQTSGLILISKDKKSEQKLKIMFENKEYNKIYIAIVKGKLESKIAINKPLSLENKNISVKMCVKEKGKESITNIEPMTYNKQHNTTLLKIIPITGRQHQIRVHLDYIGHTILGDPLYGVAENFTCKYLEKMVSKEEILEYTKANRLCLHSYTLTFKFNNKQYNIKSHQDIKDIFNEAKIQL